MRATFFFSSRYSALSKLFFLALRTRHGERKTTYCHFSTFMPNISFLVFSSSAWITSSVIEP